MCICKDYVFGTVEKIKYCCKCHIYSNPINSFGKWVCHLYICALEIVTWKRLKSYENYLYFSCFRIIVRSSKPEMIINRNWLWAKKLNNKDLKIQFNIMRNKFSQVCFRLLTDDVYYFYTKCLWSVRFFYIYIKSLMFTKAACLIKNTV